MKKAHKILVMFGLSVALFLGTAQKEAKANFPTIDISNLLQNILSFIQDADLAGAFETITSYNMQFQEWTEKMENFNKFLETWKLIQQGARYGTEILRLVTYYENECKFMWNSVGYFMSDGAAPSITQAALNSLSDFQELYKDMTEESENKTAFVEGLKNSDPLATLEAMEKVLKDYKQEFYETTSHFRCEMSKLYSQHKKMKYALQDNRWMYQRLYY